MIIKEDLNILTLFTGIMFSKDFSSVHSLAEDLMQRPIMTHEFADEKLWDEIKNKIKPQFMDVLTKLQEQAYETSGK